MEYQELQVLQEHPDLLELLAVQEHRGQVEAQGLEVLLVLQVQADQPEHRVRLELQVQAEHLDQPVPQVRLELLVPQVQAEHPEHLGQVELPEHLGQVELQVQLALPVPQELQEAQELQDHPVQVELLEKTVFPPVKYIISTKVKILMLLDIKYSRLIHLVQLNRR
jgi:hypothetical protein